MRKIYLLILLLYATAATAWAAQCPGAADIVSNKATGYQWGLTDAAKVDWSLSTLAPQSTPVSYTTFPVTAHITVRASTDTTAVLCAYVLPDGTTVDLISNKRINTSAVDISVFNKNSEQRSIAGSDLYAGRVYLVDIYTCNTYVMTASICHWDWMQ